MRRLLCALVLAAVVPACGGSGDTFVINSGSSPASGNIVALMPGNILISVSPTAPGTILTAVALTGLGTETVIGIDYRPFDGNLYLVTNASKLYRVFSESGACVALGAPFSTPLSGTIFGVDFNPTVDRLRILSEADQSLRINPFTADIAGVDTTLSYDAGDANVGANPDVSACAYNNNVAGSSTTVLYAIDATLNILVTFAGSPNLGKLITVGALGVDVTAGINFDISRSGTAYLSADGQLYTVNLTTGAATLVGPIGTGTGLIGMSVVP